MKKCHANAKKIHQKMDSSRETNTFDLSRVKQLTSVLKSKHISSKNLISKDEVLKKGLFPKKSKFFLGDLKELDHQIKSSMSVSQEKMPNGKSVNICKICGKEGERRTIIDHIEARHVEGVCHSCNLCQKTFKTRVALRQHRAYPH